MIALALSLVSLLFTATLYRFARRLLDAHNSVADWAYEAEAQLDRIETTLLEDSL